jgi:hypothetical protein
MAMRPCAFVGRKKGQTTEPTEFTEKYTYAFLCELCGLRGEQPVCRFSRT